MLKRDYKKCIKEGSTVFVFLDEDLYTKFLSYNFDVSSYKAINYETAISLCIGSNLRNQDVVLVLDDLDKAVIDCATRSNFCDWQVKFLTKYGLMADGLKEITYGYKRAKK